MVEEKRDFNKDAAAWDENPGRVRLAEKVFTAIVNRLVLSSEMEVMDFGCGTGLLSIRLLPFVCSVVGVDSSPGMLEVFKKRSLIAGLGAISTSLVDIEKELLTGSFDLVTSSMTLHHIKDIQPLLLQFYSVLKPGGTLCIADLDVDGGKFHPDPAGVFHNGFERDSVKQLLEESGFSLVSSETAAEIEKPDSDGIMRTFTIFLVTCTKRHVLPGDMLE